MIKQHIKVIKGIIREVTYKSFQKKRACAGLQHMLWPHRPKEKS